MIDVSQKFIDYSRDKNRIIDAKIEISEGEDFVIFDKTQIIDFEIENGISDGDDFSIGNVIASKLNLSLFTDYIPEKNATVKPYIRLDGKEGPTEWLQLGKFKIDNRKKQNKVWKFECFDELLKTQQLYKSNLQIPTSTKQMLQEILFYLDFEMNEEELESLQEFQITRRIEDYLYTYREVLGYIATIYAANIVIDNEGKLKFIYVTDRESKLTVNTSDYVGLNQVNELKTITKVVANTSGEREQLSMGDGDIDNTLFIQNPIITEEILEHIYNSILDFSYVPINLRSWRTFPYLECGDFVTFKQRNGPDILTVIQTNQIKYSGGLTGKITSPAKSYLQSEYGFTGDTSRAISGLRDRIGVYVLAENSKLMVIDTKFQSKLVLPITSLGTTDIEFTASLIGTATTDSILYLEIRSSEGLLGKSFKTVLREGLNTISISQLIRGIQQMSDNLLLFMKVDKGKFEIESGEGQFYAYGANLVGDSGVPYAAIEDVVEFKTYIDNDNVVTIAILPEKYTTVDTIDFNSYINSDSVEIQIEEVEE